MRNTATEALHALALLGVFILLAAFAFGIVSAIQAAGRIETDPNWTPAPASECLGNIVPYQNEYGDWEFTCEPEIKRERW